MAKLTGKFSGAEGRKSAAAGGERQNLQMKSPFHFDVVVAFDDDKDNDDVDGVMWLCGDVVIDNSNDTSGSRVNVELYLGVVSKTGEDVDALFGTLVVICKNVLSVSG